MSSKKIYFLFISLCFSYALSLFAKHSASLSDVLNSRPHKKEYLLAKDFVKERWLIKSRKIFSLQNKQLLLARKLKALLESDDFSDVYAEKMVFYIETLKRKGKIPIKKNIFIHKDQEILPFSLKLINGEVYILLRKEDPNAKKGGYKFFSRVIHYESLDVYGDLSFVFGEGSKNKPESVISELNLMHLFRKVQSIVGYINFISYVGSHQKVLQRKLAVQVPLFHADFKMLEHEELQFKDLRTLFYQAISALSKFHDEGFIHRDVKPANFLYKRDKKNGFLINLIDFGLSEDRKHLYFGKKISGSKGYIAPEVSLSWLEKRYSFKTFSQAVQSDVFSLGMTFWRILKGREENILYQKILLINKAAWAKGEDLATVDELKEISLTYEKEYHIAVEASEKLSSNSGSIKNQNDLEFLILQMLSPDVSKRPSLKLALKILK